MGKVSGERVSRGEGSVSWELEATLLAIISVPKRGTLGFSGLVGSGGDVGLNTDAGTPLRAVVVVVAARASAAGSVSSGEAGKAADTAGDDRPATEVAGGIVVLAVVTLCNEGSAWKAPGNGGASLVKS